MELDDLEAGLRVVDDVLNVLDGHVALAELPGLDELSILGQRLGGADLLCLEALDLVEDEVLARHLDGV